MNPVSTGSYGTCLDKTYPFLEVAVFKKPEVHIISLSPSIIA